MKNRLTSMVCTEYEKSPEFALHKKRLEAVLSDCKRRAEQLASYDLWLEISGTEYRSLNLYIETEDSVAFPASDEPDTGFYGSCASAQEIAANLEETCRKQMTDRDELTKAAKLRLRDMSAFLRDRGIDPDTLFSGGGSGQ